MDRWKTNSMDAPRLEIWREKEGFVVYYANRTSEILRTQEDFYSVVDAFYQETQEQGY